MNSFPFLPTRCLSCGEPVPSGPLCRRCRARYQSVDLPDACLERCTVCGQIMLAEASRCVDCSTETWSFPAVDGLFGYNDPAGELLRLYKFSAQKSLVGAWAKVAETFLTPRGPLVPVPSLRRRVWYRGWDPVRTFVLALARQSGLPIRQVLIRRPSAVQKTLDRAGRLENAHRSYRLVPNADRLMSGVPMVWLVDDVVTTGATVEACSKLLLQTGVSEVRVLCLGLH